MPEIKHRPDCDRPTGPTGTEAACNCATYQGQFAIEEPRRRPVPLANGRRALALENLGARLVRAIFRGVRRG